GQQFVQVEFRIGRPDGGNPASLRLLDAVTNAECIAGRIEGTPAISARCRHDRGDGAVRSLGLAGESRGRKRLKRGDFSTLSCLALFRRSGALRARSDL